MPAGIYAIGLP